ncbi:MAG: hypothetical protein ACRDTF_06370, partial [Pseudonocardiaceae bacterium]
MIENLLLGFPDQRPGGLLLSVLLAAAALSGAIMLGYVYAVLCATFPRSSVPLQVGLSALRGVPLLLLVFFIAQASALILSIAGAVALLLYSLTHVGEILRSYLKAYPDCLTEQGMVLGMGWLRREFQLRAPWTLLRSFEAVGTHAVSLLKDTGALTIVGIGELTTVARALGAEASFSRWALVLGTA